MCISTKNNIDQHLNELETLVDQIKHNVDCTKDIITNIDNLLEKKQLSNKILDDLVTQRNACAVNVMNFTRFMKRI